MALDEKALATGKIKHLEKGDGYDFYSHGREGPHRKIGDGYPEGGIGEQAFLETNLLSAAKYQSAALANERSRC